MNSVLSQDAAQRRDAKNAALGVCLQDSGLRAGRTGSHTCVDSDAPAAPMVHLARSIACKTARDFHADMSEGCGTAELRGLRVQRSQLTTRLAAPQLTAS